MGYTNIKDVLIDATKYPAALEAKMPAGAPKVSVMLLDAAGKVPVVPDFPLFVQGFPSLPAPFELPPLPGAPGGAGLKRYVTGVEIRPVGATGRTRAAGASWEQTPVAARGVVGQGHTVRDYA